MEFLARYLTKQMVQQKVIVEEEYEIYQYGIELILSNLIIATCIMSMGVVLGVGHLSLWFILSLGGLRSYTGGYHANRYFKCFLISCGTFIITLLIVNLQRRWQLQYSLILCSLICTIRLWRIGSLNSTKNPKTDQEMQYRKGIVRLMSSLYCGISIMLIGFMHQYVDIATVLVCAQVFTTLALKVPKIREENTK